MAIKFSNSNLQGISYQTYEINKFNGVDYTTTPTNVDDTRAIEISNYVPYGNALRKRDGWKLISTIKHFSTGEKICIHDMWDFKGIKILYAGILDEISGEYRNNGLYKMLEDSHNAYLMYGFTENKKPSEIYSQSFNFENRLFILAHDEYLMASFIDNDINNLSIHPVSDDAFIPTIAIGVGAEGTETIGSSFQQFNLLKNMAKIELLNYPYNKLEIENTVINLLENASYEVTFIDVDGTIEEPKKFNGRLNIDIFNEKNELGLSRFLRSFGVDQKYFTKNKIDITLIEPIKIKNLLINLRDYDELKSFKKYNGKFSISNSSDSFEKEIDVSSIIDGTTLGEEIQEQEIDSLHFECFYLGFNYIYLSMTRGSDTNKGETYTYDISSFVANKKYTVININGTPTNLNEDNSNIVEISGVGEVSVLRFADTGVKLYVTKTENTDLIINNPNYIELLLEFEEDNSKTVNKMRFGIPFGSYGYRDRLFLSGNPDMPNVDIHSGETNDLENPWKDYTYFPDTNYATFGTSDTKITGYGMLNNGSMAIFKEYGAGQPNLFFRNYNMMTDKDGNMVEYFPITISGLSLENNSMGQIMNYGNDLLVNNSRGIYKILAGESTATQTYYANEMSYFIRDNLGTDVSDSCHIVFEGKLYVSRRDKFGNKRIYVADENRYSFIDGRQVYEWWVLDGIQADKFWVINDELYFFNEKGLCKFVKDSFIDEYHIDVPNANINGEDFSEYAFIDDQRNHIVLNTASDVFTEIMGSAEITGARDIESAYNILRKNARIKFNGGFYAINKYDNSGISVEHWSSSDLYYIKVPLNSRSDNKYIPHLLQYQYDYNNGNFIYLGIKYNAVEIDYDESHYIITAVKVGKDETFIKDYMAIIYDQCEFEIYDILDSVYNKPLSQCDVEVGQWIWRGKDGTEYFVLGDTNEVYFNKFQLKAIDYENESFMLDFEFIPSNQLRDVTFIIPKAIESYWFSKFNALSRIDYLKTADKITFVADVRNGGDTLVGYRTNKSVVSYDSTAKPFRFDYLDFNDISFGIGEISKTYTAKKKIKNFSFMQLLFIGDKDADSTLVSLSFRYRYTKNNKGVK